MPRSYEVAFKYTAISAVQDLISCRGTAGKVCRLVRAWLFMDTVSIEAAQGMRLNVKRATATLTLGSGGASVTPALTDGGDAAATFTAHRNDTTPATTSGAFTDVLPAGGHNYNGFSWNWGPYPKGIFFSDAQGVVFELLGAPSGTVNWSGGLELEEIN